MGTQGSTERRSSRQGGQKYIRCQTSPATDGELLTKKEERFLCSCMCTNKSLLRIATFLFLQMERVSFVYIRCACSLAVFCCCLPSCSIKIEKEHALVLRFVCLCVYLTFCLFATLPFPVLIPYLPRGEKKKKKIERKGKGGAKITFFSDPAIGGWLCPSPLSQLLLATLPLLLPHCHNYKTTYKQTLLTNELGETP